MRVCRIARGKTLFLTLGYPLIGGIALHENYAKRYPPISSSATFQSCLLRKKVTSAVSSRLFSARFQYLSSIYKETFLCSFIYWTMSLSFTPVDLVFFSNFLRYPMTRKERVVTQGCSPAALRCHDSSNAAPRHLCATSSRVRRILPTPL